MIKNSSSTIKDKQSGILTASHYNKTKTCYLTKEQCSDTWAQFGIQCCLDQFSEFSQVRKALAKYVIIDMQYTQVQI